MKKIDEKARKNDRAETPTVFCHGKAVLEGKESVVIRLKLREGFGVMRRRRRVGGVGEHGERLRQIGIEGKRSRGRGRRRR
jgi:hypothetical protein